MWKTLRQHWKLNGDRHGAAAKMLTRKLFRVSVAICHAPSYEADHRDSLAQDWAHVPIPHDKDVFDEAASLGGKLAVLLDPQMDPTVRSSSRSALVPRGWAKCSGSVEGR